MTDDNHRRLLKMNNDTMSCIIRIARHSINLFIRSLFAEAVVKI